MKACSKNWSIIRLINKWLGSTTRQNQYKNKIGNESFHASQYFRFEYKKTAPKSGYILSTKIIKCDHFIRNTCIVEQFKHCIIHHRRSAKIILNIFWLIMLTQVSIMKNLVYEAL